MNMWKLQNRTTSGNYETNKLLTTESVYFSQTGLVSQYNLIWRRYRYGTSHSQNCNKAQ